MNTTKTATGTDDRGLDVPIEVKGRSPKSEVRSPKPEVAKSEIRNAETAGSAACSTCTAEPGNATLKPATVSDSPVFEVQGSRFEVQDSASSPASTLHPPPLAGAAPRAKRFLLFATAVLGLAGVAYAGYGWWSHSIAWVKTDNAYVAAHIHTVSARVAGTVKEVLAEENQEVAADGVLARLDPRDFEVRREQALAQVAQARAQLKQAQAQVSQARAQIAREQARATKARQDFERASSLYREAGGAISKQEFEQAQAENDAAQASLQGAQSALESAGALSEVATAQGKVAQANLQDSELQLSYTEIRAPAPGRIGKKNLETGNRVQPGQALLALVQPDVWITANFKETQLTHMRPDQRVLVKIDAFPGRAFTGRVESLAPASGAQFALLPPDNATGNFTRIVQRVPVKIVLDGQSLGACGDRIVPGMSAVVEVKVRE